MNTEDVEELSGNSGASATDSPVSPLRELGKHGDLVGGHHPWSEHRSTAKPAGQREVAVQGLLGCWGFPI